MLLHEIPELAALRHPDATALVAGDRTCTFAELADRVGRLSTALAALAPAGERVAVVADNCPAWVECYYAVPRAGLVLAFLNQRLAPAELADVLAAAEPAVLVGEAVHLATLAPLAARFPSVRTIVAVDDADAGQVDYEELVAGADPGPAAGKGAAGDVAWLIHTSGTTGRPKGAMLTHAGLVAATLTTALARPVAPDDVYLFPFPLCHVAGYNVLLFHLHGRPVVLVPRFEAGAVVAAVARHAVTAVSLAPTMIRAVLDELDRSPAPLPSLRAVGYGASPIAPDLLRRAVDRFGAGVAFSQGYGMTELSGNAVFLDADDHRRAAAGETSLLRAAGRASPLVAVRIVDEAGVDVAPGHVGEIAVRGDQVMAGYWRDPGATAAAVVDGWLRTGDLGSIDAAGYLHVVDRKKDVIVTGGENVASREVEDVLVAHPDVVDAAVVGLPDPYWGERVTAVVVLRPGSRSGPADVASFVRERLAGFKRPKEVIVVDALPRNAAGKVPKAELRATLAAGQDGGRAGR